MQAQRDEHEGSARIISPYRCYLASLANVKNHKLLPRWTPAKVRAGTKGLTVVNQQNHEKRFIFGSVIVENPGFEIETISICRFRLTG